MSNSSGFTGLPPGTTIQTNGFPPGQAEMKAKIIEIRGEIRVQKARERMEGEIVGHNRDSSTRIKTRRGEITVHIQARERPAQGTKVEVEIPRGDPPRQVILRPLPDRDAAAPQKPDLSRYPPRPATQRIPQDRVDITPSRPDPPITGAESGRQIDEKPPPASDRPRETVERPSLAALLTQSNAAPVRIIPLTAEQAAAIILRPAQDMVRTVLSLPPTSSSLSPPVVSTLMATAAPSPETAQQTMTPPVTVVTPDNPAYPFLHTIEAGQATAPTVKILQTPPSQHAISGVVTHMPGGAETIISNIVTSAPSANIQATAAQADRMATIRPEALSPGTYAQTTPPGVTADSRPAFNAFQAHDFFAPPVMIGAPGAPSDHPFFRVARPETTRFIAGMNITPGQTQAVVEGISAEGRPVIGVLRDNTARPDFFMISAAVDSAVPGTIIQAGLHHIPARSESPAPAAGAQIVSTAPFNPISFFGSFQWPAMEELQQSLQAAQGSAVTARILGQAALNPAAPSRLPFVAMLFIAAMRAGDVSGWLGERATEQLRRAGKGDLLNRISRDFSGIRQASADALPHEWRSLAMPLYYDSHLHKLFLHYKQDRDQQDDSGKIKGTRFIFDLTLGRMGDIQIDGLHRPLENGGRVDLVVRTLTPLSDGMKQTMRQNYAAALKQTSLTGEISFQSGAGKFVKPAITPRENTAMILT